MLLMCPTPAMTTVRALGMRSCMVAAVVRIPGLSRSPYMMRVGAEMFSRPSCAGGSAE